ncbi:MAG: hypothetical protein ACLPSF_12645 [Methylocella sp.]
MGAMLFIAVASQTLPLHAESVLRAPQNQSAANQTIASHNENDAADSDATGAIDKGAQPRVTVSPVDSSRIKQGSFQGEEQISYEAAFRNWRSCAVMHQGVGNPPPQCEPLRAALRQAIGFRPRGLQTVEARPRS